MTRKNQKDVPILNPANMLTFSRLPLSITGILLFETGYLWLGAIFMAFAAFTDAIDGKVARKYGVESDLGAKLDPIIDKIEILFVSIFLFYNLENSLAIMALIAMIISELLIAGYSTYSFKKEGRAALAVTNPGKKAMLFKTLSIGFIILGLTGDGNFQIGIERIGIFLAIPAVILTLQALYSYIKQDKD